MKGMKKRFSDLLSVRFGAVKLILGKAFLLLLFLNLFSCSLFAKEACPYLVSGSVRLVSETGEFEAAGFDLFLMNKSEKTIKNFTLVFFLFDEDGEPISNGKSNFVISVSKELEGGNSLEACISLDPYLSEIPEYPYEVDYLYISRVEYEDGSVWEDPLGLNAF